MRAHATVLGASVLLAFLGCSADRTPSPSRAGELRSLGVVPGASEAQIELPRRADEAVTITSPHGELSARFTVRGASRATGHTEGGATVYPGALDGGDLVHVPVADGFEDLAFFDQAPARETIEYDLDVTRIAGLRQVASSLELLDARGAPRLRVERPWLRDADGRLAWIDLTIEGCAVDRDPRVPWDRPVVAPGASSCRLRLAWSGRGVRYPLVVDPAWRVGTSPTRRHDHASITFASGRVASLSGYFSASVGMGTGPQDSGEIYDPTTGTWSSLFFLPVARQNGALALLPSGRAFFVGGDGSGRAELISDQGVIARADGDLANFSFGPGASATSLPNGKILVAGGSGSDSAARLYDEASNAYANAGTSPPGSLKTPRAFHTATRLPSGKVLLAGGSGAADAELYDPVTNTFTTVPNPMVSARSHHTASLLAGGTVLLASGTSAEIYDPATNAFTPTGALGTSHDRAEAVVLDSGDVMIAGGDGPLGSVEIYDVKTKAWTAQTPLLFGRTRFQMARLPQGAVMVFGGLGVTSESIGDLEIWTPGAAGRACTTGDDCRSGVCDDGICCATACATSCNTCAPGTGACVAVIKADDPSSCTGASTCDAAGTCRRKNGQACSAAADCASALCVDGTCCDRACDGQCEACDVPGQRGVCSPVAGAPHGTRPGCSAAGTTCGGACNGLVGSTCVYPSALTVCATSCSGSDLTTNTCDGRGACADDVPRPCSGNFVCADASSCKASCATNADCRSEYQCEQGRCVPIALCEERFVTKGTERIDCYPYTCEQAGACRTACASVADCVAPTICAFDGRCVDPPPPPAIGCSASAARASSGGGALGLGLGLLFFAVRRRRAR